MAFARNLRLAIYFYEKANRDEREVREDGKREKTGVISKKMPWEKPNEFNPDSGQNEALGNFLNKVMAYIFDPKNKRKFVDNFTHREGRDLRRWNKDERNPSVIRVQDKGSCFLVDFYRMNVEIICSMFLTSKHLVLMAWTIAFQICKKSANGQDNGRWKVFLGCRNAMQSRWQSKTNKIVCQYQNTYD